MVRFMEHVEQIIVYKSIRKLELWSVGSMIRTYHIALGQNPEGHKLFEGDGRTPEGEYFIDDKNPKSKFYLNLGISYPNDEDRRNAYQTGKEPGGDIKIHGLPKGYGWIGKFHKFKDWTAGCIAVSNKEIREIYDLVEIGTPIKINP